MEDPYETDRGRGFLTKTDREYLLGETNPEGQSKYQKETRIRKRIENAVADFTLLASGRGLRLGRDVFEDSRINHNGHSLREEDLGKIQALGIMQSALFNILRSETADSGGFGDFTDPRAHLFKLAIQNGIERMLQILYEDEYGKYADVKARFFFQNHGQESITELIDRYEAGTLISRSALDHLVEIDEITPDEYEKYIDNLPDEYKRKMWVSDPDPTVSTLVHPDDIEDPLTASKTE